MFGKIILAVAGNAVGVYFAAKFVDGVKLNITPWTNLLLIGGFLGFANAFIKPIIKFFSLPLIIMTLGLFTIIINVALLYAADFLFTFFSLKDLIAAFLATIVIGIINFAIHFLAGE